jgi:DNA-binding response OmpR family regulator
MPTIPLNRPALRPRRRPPPERDRRHHLCGGARGGRSDDEGPEAELRRDAACILRLEREAQNRFLLRTEDHTGPEPHEEGWVFQVREGVGIVERPGITAAPRRVTFVGTGELPPRLLDALMRDYEIAPADVLDALPAEIVDQRYGVIIVGVESRRPRPGIELIRRLRENGVTAGIVLHAAAENFRRAARAEAIRAGVDDIVMDDFSREEYLERVERARSRDRTSPPRPQEGYEPVYQPVGRDGEPELMAEEAMRSVVRNRVTTLPDAHFAVVRLRPVHITTKEAWDVLVRQLRLSNGDLIAQTSDALVIYLHDVELDDLHDILERLGASHPGLGGSAAVSIAWHPADTEYLAEWAGRERRSPRSRADDRDHGVDRGRRAGSPGGRARAGDAPRATPARHRPGGRPSHRRRGLGEPAVRGADLGAAGPGYRPPVRHPGGRVGAPHRPIAPSPHRPIIRSSTGPSQCHLKIG